MIHDYPTWALNLRRFRIARPFFVLAVALLTLVTVFYASQIQFPLSDWDEVQSRGGVDGLQFSPNRRVIATEALGHGVQFWDASNKRLLDSLGDKALATQLEFSPDSDFFAWSHQRYAFFYDVRLGRMVFDPIKAQDWIYSMTFSPDGETLATGGGPIELWNVYVGELKHSVVADTGEGVGSLAFSSDGTMLAAGLSDGSIHIWSLSPAKEVAMFDSKELFTMEGHSGYVSALAFSYDTQTLASGGQDGLVILWDVRNGKETLRVNSPRKLVSSVAFSPKGEFLAVGANGEEFGSVSNRDGAVAAWHSSDGRTLWSFDDHKSYITNVGFTHDSEQVTADYADGKSIEWRLP